MPEPALEPAADFLARQAVAAEAVAEPLARRRRLRRVLLRPQAIIVGLAVLVLVILAIVGPALAPYNPVNPDPVNEFLPPQRCAPDGHRRSGARRAQPRDGRHALFAAGRGHR